MSAFIVLVRAMAEKGGGPFSVAQLRDLVGETLAKENEYAFTRAEALGLVVCRAYEQTEKPEDGFARERPLPRERGRLRAWKLTKKGWAVATNRMEVRAPAWNSPSSRGGRPKGAVVRLRLTWLSALPEGIRIAPTGSHPGAIELPPDDPRLRELPDGSLVVIRRGR